MSTHQQASVIIDNQTGSELLSVSIAHKYSDDYSNSLNWTSIQNGTTTSPIQNNYVDYTTGILTTGRDWWYISFVTADGKTYMTNPDNFRPFFDILEDVGRITGLIAGIIFAVTSKLPGAKTVALASGVTAALTAAMLNSATTSGFKQHILREEDADANADEMQPRTGKNATKIILKLDGVEFVSNSGTSDTVVTEIPSGTPAPQ